MQVYLCAYRIPKVPCMRKTRFLRTNSVASGDSFTRDYGSFFLMGVFFLGSFPLILGIVYLVPFFYSLGFHIFGKLTGLSGVVSSGR